MADIRIVTPGGACGGCGKLNCKCAVDVPDADGDADDCPASTTIQAGTATLVAGAATVAGVTMNAASVVQVTRNTPGGTLGNLSAPAASRNASPSERASNFGIASDSASETSTVDWLVITTA